MQNETGEFVDMYIPRKCSASNRIIAAKDHASIQINIADVDPTTGRMTGSNTTYAICGNIRRMMVLCAHCNLMSYYRQMFDSLPAAHGESDDSLIRLAKRDHLIAQNF